MKNTKRKKSSGNHVVLLALVTILAVLAVAAGMFYAFGRSEKDIMDNKDSKEKKEVSLLDESIEAQRILDNILLKKTNWQLIEREHGEKDVNVAGVNTSVKIAQRQLAVGVPASTDLQAAGSWLQEKAAAAGLVSISGKDSKYKDWDAYKVEIGIAVKAGSGKKQFVTDTVYFFHNSNLHGEDKDVKKVQEKPESRKYSGKLAVIVDDCGYDMSSVRTLLNTGLPLNFAVLPYKPYSSDVLEMIKSDGRVAMLHLPMEPMDRSAMSEGSSTICTDMSKDKILELTRKAINSLPGVSGVNNHQGSKATADSATMTTVLQELRNQDLFFVDSRTSSKSVARDKAVAMGVPTARNDIFLDNSSDVQAIRKQIYKAMDVAEKNGSAIAICHARPNTAKAWSMYAEEIKNTGIELVPITDLLY
jgi:polysaccharide deacetylase 2 family uncharacterized protein YibQ